MHLYYYYLFYNEWTSLKQSFGNTSELIKLHHCHIFLEEDALSALQAHGYNIIIYLSIW